MTYNVVVISAIYVFIAVAMLATLWDMCDNGWGFSLSRRSPRALVSIYAAFFIGRGFWWDWAMTRPSDITRDRIAFSHTIKVGAKFPHERS
jgi:hypothetical protein